MEQQAAFRVITEHVIPLGHDIRSRGEAMIAASDLVEAMKATPYYATHNIVDSRATARYAITIGNCPLSERENEILAQLARGLTNKEIGNALLISEATVKVHMKSMMRKIGARNRTEVALWFVEQTGGILPKAEDAA